MQQDNPQQAAAYVAGYMDGEACLRIQHAKARNPNLYMPQVKIVSVVRESLDFVQSVYGGSIREYQPQSLKGNARKAFEWTLQGRKHVLRLMQDIQPFCIVKREQVLLMIEFIVEGEISTPPTPISQEELRRRARIFEQFKVLNQRGVQLQRLSASAPSGDATVRSAGTIQPAEVNRNVNPPSILTEG